MPEPFTIENTQKTMETLFPQPTADRRTHTAGSFSYDKPHIDGGGRLYDEAEAATPII